MPSQKQFIEPKEDVIYRRKKSIQRKKTVLKTKDRIQNSIEQWMINLEKSFKVEQKDKDRKQEKT